MPLFTVTPEDLRLAAVKCQQTAQNLEDELQRLGAFVQEVQATYLGVASAAFNTLMMDYQANSKRLVHALVGISQLLDRVYHEYTGTEEKNTSNFTSVGAAMPSAPIPSANL